jgi:hypothetical protein
MMMLFHHPAALLVALACVQRCLGSSQRISSYVAEGQQFFILDSTLGEAIILYEDPDATPVSLDMVYWFCSPEHAPANEDGDFDSVVAHAVTYRPNVNETALAEQGATISGSGTFSVHGYAASSMEDGYSETLVDYDDMSLHFFNDLDDDDDEGMATLTSVETSEPGGTGGFTFSGVGKWTTDATDALLVSLKDDLGTELTHRPVQINMPLSGRQPTPAGAGSGDKRFLRRGERACGPP